MGTLMFLVGIVFPFLLEGLGVQSVRGYMPFYYAAFPSIVALVTLLEGKTLRFPRSASIIFILFLIPTLVSALFFSVDKQVSFELALFYVSLFFIFVYFYNHPVDETRVYIKLTWIAAIFSVFFLAVKYIKPLDALIPATEYQLVYPSYGSHNHLGDFIGLVMVVLLYELLRKGRIVLVAPFLLFAPILFLSFSRSAYLSFGVAVLLLYLFEKAKNKITSRIFSVIVVVCVIAVAGFMVVTVRDAQRSAVLNPIYRSLTETFALQDKDFLGGRSLYFSQALQAFYEHPLFGVGSGNFGFASKKYQEIYGTSTSDAHNLFFEILAENGGLAAIALLMLVIVIVKGSIGRHNLFLYLFLYLLSDFQTDYTYKIYGLLVLFFVFAALSYKEEYEWKSETMFGLGSLALLITLVLILTSTLLLMKGKPREALRLYPFNKEAYRKAIDPAVAKKLEAVAPYDAATLLYLSDVYAGYGEKRKSLELLERVYESNRFSALEIVKKIYTLKKETQSEENANKFAEGALQSYLEIPYYIRRGSFQNDLEEFCLQFHSKPVCSRLLNK